MVGGNPQHDAYGFRYWKTPVNPLPSTLEFELIPDRELLRSMLQQVPWGGLKVRQVPREIFPICYCFRRTGLLFSTKVGY